MVALHRAVRLARADPSARVLLTTYNEHLAAGLRDKLALLGAPPNVTVSDLRSAALAEHERLLGPVRIATAPDVRAALAAAAEGAAVDPGFLRDEWRLIVDARDVRDAATYRDLPRHGRRTRLTGDRRDALWTVFARTRAALAARGLKTYAEALHDTAAALAAEGEPPFDHILVDEAQDLTLAELRFLKAACSREINGLFFAGDIGQRIFRPPFAWVAEGIEIRGRSRSLKVNYRTSRQNPPPRRPAPPLPPARARRRRGGPHRRPVRLRRPRHRSSAASRPPRPRSPPSPPGSPRRSPTASAPRRSPSSSARSTSSPAPSARSPTPARTTPRSSARPPCRPAAISLSTMHAAKGREFRAVAVMACDASILPSPRRLAEAADETALEEIFLTERHLLYVACTRARDHLLIAGGLPISEFLRDLVHSASKSEP